MQDAAASCIMRWCSSAASRCDRFHGVAEGAPGGTRSAYYEEVQLSWVGIGRDPGHPPLVLDMRMASSQRGFTLIELLIVMVIIGILAALAIPKFANSKQKAYTTAMKSDLHSLVVAEEAFFADSERYTAYLDTTQTGRGRRRRTTTVSSSGLNFDPSTGVSVPLIAVGPGYWSATVTHTQISNFSCGIGVNTVNPVDATASDGAPVCK